MKVCPSCMAEFAGGEVFCPVDGARLTTPSRVPPPTQDPLVGDTLAERYRVLRPIGEGGMGVVYEAEHVLIEKRVALKVLRADFSQKEEVVERFRQEAKSASRIGHEHIVDISDFGETPDGRSYFVMEYLEGEDVASLLEREGTLAPDRAVHIAMQCCRALGAAHRKGIVHRDMKPENVFLVRREDAQDFVKVVDFGIAKMSDIETAGSPGRKLTKTGMIFGTPEYMSPEQAAGKELDYRVDVYALGIILYEMIAGRVPFVGDTFMAVLRNQMFEEPPRLREVNPAVRVSPDLEAVIHRALAKEPDARFANMEEMSAALSAALEWSDTAGTDPGVADPLAPRISDTPGAAPALPRMDPEHPGEPEPPPAPPMRQIRRPVWLAAGGVALMALVGLVLWLGGDDPAGTPPDGTEAPTMAEASAPEDPASAGEADAVGSGSEETAPDEAEVAADPEQEEAPPDDPASPVAVAVRTQPSGARLVVVGHGEVCAATPCTFQVSPGEPVELVARRGRRVVRRVVDPAETVDVSLRLPAPRPTRRDPSPEASAEPPPAPSGEEAAASADEPKEAPNEGAEDEGAGGEPEPSEADAPPDAPEDLKVPDLFR